jgi:DNA-binding transcriptional LysR family regulator
VGFFGRRRGPKCAAAGNFTEPCPYREAALRTLAGSQKQWRIISTSSSLAGVRAAAMAGLAITPIPLQTIKPGLRVLGKKDKMPKLPDVQFVLHGRESDTRPMVSALENIIGEMAVKTTFAGSSEARTLNVRRPRRSL